MFRKWFSRRGTLAIDIGTYSIKLCVSEITKEGIRLQLLEEIRTPPDTVREGTVIEPRSIGFAIQDALQKQGTQPATTLLTVGGPTAAARPVRLPRMPIETLRKTIHYEAGRYLPTATEEHYIGFEVLAEHEEQMEVLIVAAPRDLVQSQLRTLEWARLEPEIVEIAPFALQRAVALVHSDLLHSDQPLAIIDLGGTHTQVTVARGSALALTRYIPIGGETLTAALTGYFHYSREEAEQVKRALNLTELIQKPADPTENAPLRLLQPILDELVREIRRSLNYYQSQMTEEGNKQVRVEQLLMVGGTTLLRGIEEYFASKLNLPTKIVNPLGSPPFDLAQLGSDQVARGPIFTTVLGAMGGLLEEMRVAA